MTTALRKGPGVSIVEKIPSGNCAQEASCNKKTFSSHNLRKKNNSPNSRRTRSPASLIITRRKVNQNSKKSNHTVRMAILRSPPTINAVDSWRKRCNSCLPYRQSVRWTLATATERKYLHTRGKKKTFQRS